jgi:hypothetical protein
MSAFKKLTRQDFYVSDYTSKKGWIASGSTFDSYKLETLRGFSGSTPGYPYPTDYRNNRYEKLTYNSIAQVYLADSNGNGTYGSRVLDSNLLEDSTTIGISRDHYAQTTLTLSQSRVSTSEVAVVSIPKEVFGVGIEPGTVVIEPQFEETDSYYTGSNQYVAGPDWSENYVERLNEWYNSFELPNTGSYIAESDDYVSASYLNEFPIIESGSIQRYEIVDNGEGKLILSGANAHGHLSAPERAVGDAIYTHGNLVITDPVVARYYSTYGRLVVRWKSKLPIYTYNVHCTVRESELNHTFNPSAISGSENNVRANLTGSEFKPYVTSVGLYNEANELIAVAKMNRPIPKSQNVDMTFVIKLDI